MALQQLESENVLFPSLRTRELSPRRVPTDELPTKDLKRFVRVEKPTQALAETGSFPRTANALEKLGHQAASLKELQRKLKDKTAPTIKEKLAVISGIKADLLVASAPSCDDERTRQLHEQHKLTSKGSPFLSGTLTYTQGAKSQADYVNRLREEGKPATITISHTDRAVPNKCNTAEQELLLPIAEHSREVTGTYTIQPDGASSYVDTSGNSPRTYFNKEANDRFDAAAVKSFDPSLQ
jgi:hypothetical protein